MVRFALGALLAAAFQFPPDNSRPPREPEEKRLPDGRSQSEAILKEEHKRTMRELDEMAKLIQDLRAEFEKNEHHVVSLSAIRKLEDVEKRCRRIRDRQRR
jgi:hypothetical protein